MLSGGGRSPISHVASSTPGGSLSALDDKEKIPYLKTEYNQTMLF
jgi:hypothetical protein